MSLIPFSVIFLAGGIGSRMGLNRPKQYLLLQDKPLALYSFEVFAALPEVQEIVVVCESDYESLFQNTPMYAKLTFARPGPRRQDSVWNGLSQLSMTEGLVCVHDSARPLIKASLVRKVVAVAAHCDAAVLGVPVKATIKICDPTQMILSTPDRSALWEMQTPQVVQMSWLKKGFNKVHAENLTVTDDVSVIELIGKAAKVVESSYENIKVTTPDDLVLVQRLLEEHVFV